MSKASYRSRYSYQFARDTALPALPVLERVEAELRLRRELQRQEQRQGTRRG